MRKILLNRTDLKLFYEFARMNQDEKTAALKHEGIYIDKDVDPVSCVNLYYLNGFFVEETINRQSGATEIIPFKQGYKFERFFELRQNEEYRAAS